MKGIAKAIAKGNYTLSGKQKKMPGSVPAPKYKPVPRVNEKRKIIPLKDRNKLAVKKSSRA